MVHKQKKWPLEEAIFYFKRLNFYLNNLNSDTWKLVLVHIAVTLHL